MKFPLIASRIKRLHYKTPVLIEGGAGIGKTQWVMSLADELRLKFVKLDCSQSGDEGDMIGMLEIENHIHKHTRPEWLVSDQPILLFIDELNRAKKEIISGLMQLCSPEQKFNGFQLAPGSRVIVAQNPADIDANGCGNLNRPLRTRFAYFYAECDADTWIKWAINHNISKTIISFIQDNNNYLYVDSPDADENDPNTVNPRSWENFSYMYENAYQGGDYTDSSFNYTDSGLELIRQDAKSILGPDMATLFKKWIESQGNIINAEKILNATKDGWDKYARYINKMSGVDMTNLTNNICSMVKNLVETNTLSKVHADNFCTYFFTIPREMQTQMWALYFKDMMKKTYDGTKWLRNVFDIVGETTELEFKEEMKNLISNKDVSIHIPSVSNKYEGLLD